MFETIQSTIKFNLKVESTEYSMETQLFAYLHRIAFVRRIPTASMTIKGVRHLENACARRHLEQLNMMAHISMDQQFIFDVHVTDRRRHVVTHNCETSVDSLVSVC